MLCLQNCYTEILYYFLGPISFCVIYRGKFKYCPMCPKSSQLAAAMLLIFCVDLECTWDGHGRLWKHNQQCRLILTKRQIEGRGFQNCSKKKFLAHVEPTGCPASSEAFHAVHRCFAHLFMLIEMLVKEAFVVSLGFVMLLNELLANKDKNLWTLTRLKVISCWRFPIFYMATP